MNKPQSPRRPRGRGPKRPKSMGGGNGGNRPENRGRGNPKQMLEKYRMQARDAMQSGDRVLAEYYFQFADHYQRLVNERYGVSIVDADEDGDFGDDEEDEFPSQLHRDADMRQPSRTERAEAAESDRRRQPRDEGDARGQRHGEDEGPQQADDVQMQARNRRRRRNRPERPERSDRSGRPGGNGAPAAEVVATADSDLGDRDDQQPLVIVTDLEAVDASPRPRRRRRPAEEPVEQ